jgi:RNA polymerase sigma factor (sigma-70 family)
VKSLAVARRPTAAPDGVLVQEAAAGGGESYAALYDRYSTQVYNYCLRLTGSPEDAADATQGAFVNVLGRLQDDDRPVLDFASYLFTAARNESYSLMRRRSRTHPTEVPPGLASPASDVETDPERAALLRDSQEAVRQANGKLAPRHREVLALREVAGRSYDEIGQIMGISENAAAQLIWRARAKLKEALTAGAVASVIATSDACETAQLLINRLHDGEPITDAEHMWLEEHLDECGSCRAARGMIFEVGASYRAWAPVAVLATMRPEVLTQAGHAIGADWSGVAGKAGGSHTAVAGTATVAVVAAAGLAIAGLLHDDMSVTREGAPTPQAPAESKAKSSPAPKASKPDTPAAARSSGVHALTKAPVDEAPAEQAAPPPRGGPSPQPRTAPPRPNRPKPKAPAQPVPKVEQPPVEPPAQPKPTPPAEPKPTVPAPPPPAPSGGCTFPGHGNGPGGCPPGHGGIPPGQGGVPPGQVGREGKRSPGRQARPGRQRRRG